MIPIMEDNEDHPNVNQNDMPHQTDGIAVLIERANAEQRQGTSLQEFFFLMN